MAKVVYLAGPMSGFPYFNFLEFFRYEEVLRRRGFEVWSPARNDVNKHGAFYLRCPTGSHEELKALGGNVPTYRSALKDDLLFILDHADAIAVMPGWEHSKGARVEKALADCLGLEIIYLS